MGTTREIQRKIRSRLKGINRLTVDSIKESGLLHIDQNFKKEGYYKENSTQFVDWADNNRKNRILERSGKLHRNWRAKKSYRKNIVWFRNSTPYAYAHQNGDKQKLRPMLTNNVILWRQIRTNLLGKMRNIL